MSHTNNLTGYFLLAMPAMIDPTFQKSVTLICEHNDKGAMGLILNRTIDMTVELLFKNLELPVENPDIHDRKVLLGGPVQTERGFVLHRPIGDWQHTLPVFDNIGVTTSKDVLKSIALGYDPQEYLITLGYAGWSEGQLETEIANNDWLTVPASPDIIFNTAPETRYAAAVDLLGIDLSNLSMSAGHA